MGKTFSLPVAIAPITALFVGGVGCMINEFWTWAIPLWVLVVVWIVTIIIYRKQVIDIDIWKCDVENFDIQRKDFDLVVNGFIKTRHSDSISELRLSLMENSISPLSKSIHGTGNNPRNFEVRSLLSKIIKFRGFGWVYRA